MSMRKKVRKKTPAVGGVRRRQSMRTKRNNTKPTLNLIVFFGLATINPTYVRFWQFPSRHTETAKGSAITNSHKLQPLVTIPDSLQRKKSVSMVIFSSFLVSRNRTWKFPPWCMELFLCFRFCMFFSIDLRIRKV